jgi:hypothetical protein
VQQLRDRLIEEEKQVQNVRLIFKNIKLKVNRIHIWFEDDYYNQYLKKNFSFGISIEQLNIQTTGDQWQFNTAKKYMDKK